MFSVQRRLGPLLAILLVGLLLPFTAAPVLAESGASTLPGFRDEPVLTGLDHPMAIAIAPNGNVFVAEKRGTIRFFTSLTDQTPTTFADLSTNVHNYWDRGLLGLAVDPGYPARPYVYVMYAYNHILGDPAPAPRWPSADAETPPGSPYDDRCPSPPRPTTDGCVISGRLSRLTASGGVMSGPEHVIIEDWCQQFPSHSAGNLMFGPEGALYVSGGDGASFTNPDYGQLGGTVAGTPTPSNPCGDPPGTAGSLLTPPSAEGGALRAQDLRTGGDPVTLDGALLRIDPNTGLGWSTNALAGQADANARRIIAHGFRNPFRFTIRPGTSEVWIGDVGLTTWEEIDRLPDPTATPRNFGWPCREGNGIQPAYSALGLAICDGLSDAEVTTPYYTYKHNVAIVPNDGCTTAGSSISGLAFLGASSGYPDAYDGALFMADYSRRCIFVLPAGAGGLPDVAARVRFANLDRAGSETDGGAVFLTKAPDGDLMYVDFDRGEIRRIHYYGLRNPPVARFTATPSSGPAPLVVNFNASTSSDADADPLTYAWDLDGDGQYDDGSTVTASRTYPTIANVTVRLRVTDPDGQTDVASRTISAGNSPPVVTIAAPTAALTWRVGDTVAFSASANDAQDGTLPASAFHWTLTMRHCPSACHSHVIQSFSGVRSGSFVAPDHEVPSHLLLSVEVTDANGTTATDEVELYPETGTVAVTTSPAGVVTSINDATGQDQAVAAIVGSVVTVTAPATAIIGEETWTFQSWSDGGDRSHGVPVTAGEQDLIASYRLTGSSDRSGTCAGSGPAVAPTGRWQLGKFGTPNDVDWYRFKLTATTRMRLVLGDLPVTARMELYKGCTTLLQTADRGGTGSEEIIRSLPAGTYAIRLVGNGGPTVGNHALLMQRLSNTVKVLTARARTEGSTLRLVGEVFNNTSRTVGPVTVTAKLYNAAGVLLATRSARVDLPYVAARTRAPFSIVGSKPAGYDHVAWSVKAPVTSRRIANPAPKVVSATVDAGGHWVVTGTVSNVVAATVGSLGVAVTIYDARRNVLDVARASVPTRTLARGAMTTFRATFLSTGLSPNLIYVRGVVVR